jgi:hypothetical protein
LRQDLELSPAVELDRAREALAAERAAAEQQRCEQMTRESATPASRTTEDVLRQLAIENPHGSRSAEYGRDILGRSHQARTHERDRSRER